MSSPLKAGGAFAARSGERPKYFGIMRAAATFAAVAMLVQGITAGRLLSGAENGRDAHAGTGSLVIIGLVAVILAASAVRRNGGKASYAGIGLVLLALTLVQMMLGENGKVAVHVPLGVALACGAAVLTYKTWTGDR